MAQHSNPDDAYPKPSEVPPEILEAASEAIQSLRRAPGLPAAVQRHVDQALTSFETAIGGRAKLIAALAPQAALVAPDTAEAIDRLLTVLADPAAGEFSLARLAKHAGLSVAEVLRVYKDCRIAQAHVEAFDIIAEHTKAVVQDVMDKARPRMIDCPACLGVGQILPRATKKTPEPEPQDCRPCQATGRILSTTDLDAQKIALALAGLLQGTKGSLSLTVNQTANTQVNTQATVLTPGAFAKMQTATDRILFGTEPPLPSSTPAPPTPSAPPIIDLPPLAPPPPPEP